jgi:hypothetical protein
MDANSFVVQSLDMADQLSNLSDHLGMSYNKFSVMDNLLFYVGEKTSNVGAIDIHKKQVLWTKQIETVDNAIIREVLIYNNKFCVLDALDNFCSFEYENDLDVKNSIHDGMKC